MQIETRRFILRKLSVDDVTDRYLSWLRGASIQPWIVTALDIHNLEDLRIYVRDRCNKENIIFLGIFLKKDNLHIGNLKFEPIIVGEGRAELGILIGDPNFRGKGVFPEVLEASVNWLRLNLKIRQISLGVACENLMAVKAYKNAGFIEEISLMPIQNHQQIRMVLNI